MAEYLIYLMAGGLVWAIGAAIHAASKPGPKDNVIAFRRKEDWTSEQRGAIRW